MFDSDLEDISLVLDGNSDPVSEIEAGSAEVKAYIAAEFSNLFLREQFDEALSAFLEHEGAGRVTRLKSILGELVA